jgi:hypothetical protein
MHVSFESKIEVKVVDIVTKYTISSEHAHWSRLCSIVETNSGVFDREQVAKTLTLPKANIQRLFDQGVAHNLWDTSGKLTSDGLATASNRIVHSPESGALRLWLFEHPITGIVPILVERNRTLPLSKENKGGQPKGVRNLLEKLCNQGRFTTLIPSKKGANQFQLISNNLGKNWQAIDSFSTTLTMNWTWKHTSSGFELSPELNLSGDLAGSKRDQRQSIGNKSIPYENTIDPNQKFREWLSSGEFASSPWDIEHSGMRRPYDKLSVEEKLRQTIESISLTEGDIRDWDSIKIRDIPLIVANENDATQWALFLLEKRNPGYWNSEQTSRLLSDISCEDLFCTVASDDIVNRVNKELEKIKIGSRVSKLFNAGDDMSSVFVIEEHVLKEMKEANKAQYTAEDGFSNFFNRISDGISGQSNEIWYVDRFTADRRARKELSKVVTALRNHFTSAAINLLTSSSQYRPKEIEDMDACVAMFRNKLTEICDNVRFMEEGGFDCPHHRYIIIKTNKETRWWVLDDGLLSGLDRPKHAGLWNQSDVEKSLVRHLEAHQNKEASK